MDNYDTVFLVVSTTGSVLLAYLAVCQGIMCMRGDSGDYDMTNEEIKEIYDSHPNATLSDLSYITGKSVEELKDILMERES